MTTLALHQDPNQYSPLMESLTNAANKIASLPDGFSRDGWLINPSDGIEPGKVVMVVGLLANHNHKQSFQNLIVRYNLGHLILTICAQKNCDVVEVIDEYGLESLTKLSRHTIQNTVTVVKKTAPSELREGCSWTTLEVLSQVKIPDDPAKALEWRKKKSELLDEAAANPDGRTMDELRSEITGFMAGMGEKPEKPRSRYDILYELVIELRRLIYFDKITVEERDEFLEELGYEKRGDLLNKIESIEAECLQRKIFEPLEKE